MPDCPVKQCSQNSIFIIIAPIKRRLTIAKISKNKCIFGRNSSLNFLFHQHESSRQHLQFILKTLRSVRFNEIKINSIMVVILITESVRS